MTTAWPPLTFLNRNGRRGPRGPLLVALRSDHERQGRVTVFLIIGRAFCAHCRIVATVIRQAEAEVRCPHCGELADLDACGDEARRQPSES